MLEWLEQRWLSTACGRCKASLRRSRAQNPSPRRAGCLGITLSFHRQLSHRAFATPKWLEYALAYCGVLAVQGDPTEWVSSHRFHHLHTDTPLDPHSPYEGFWWSHMGWLLDNKARCCSGLLPYLHSRLSSLCA